MFHDPAARRAKGRAAEEAEGRPAREERKTPAGPAVPRPRWVPPGFDFDGLDAQLQQVLVEIVNPAYEQLVVRPPKSVDTILVFAETGSVSTDSPVQTEETGPARGAPQFREIAQERT